MTKENAQLKYDLCVIGAGPAGIILALEYAALNPDKRIALLEFGKPNSGSTNVLDDKIQVFNSVNHHPPYECTNKGLGGTSQTWGGRCVNFDPVDFTHRPILNGGCTWDEAFYWEVMKFKEKAATYFECGKACFSIEETEFKNSRIADFFIPGNITDVQLERWSKPTRFGKRYRSELEEYTNITLFEGCEAQRFEFNQESGCISQLMCYSSILNQNIIIEAINFAVSAGGQESTRLILKNKQIFSNLTQVPAALGKYYQGHISGKIASVKFYGDPEKTDFGFLRDQEGIYLRRRFSFSQEFLESKNLLNTVLWLDNPLYHEPQHKSGPMSFMYLMMLMPVLGKKLAPPAIAQSITKGKVNSVGKHLLNILKDFPSSCFIPLKIFYKRYCLKRKLPGVFLYNASNIYSLHFHAEQVPDVRNCMEIDEHGVLSIKYELTDADIESVVQVHKELDIYLRRINCGELIYWHKENEIREAIRNNSKDGLHQTGTLRIGRSDQEGVVDSNLQVYGTKNLYINSSAVFPTSGQANPTFFLGAASIRLAHHLSKR